MANISITINSTYADIVTFQGGRFKGIPRDHVEKIQKFYKSHISAGEGYIDLFECSKALDEIGSPKTIAEIRNDLGNINRAQAKKLSFLDFLMFLAPLESDKNNAGSQQNLAKSEEKLNKSEVGSKASFFENQGDMTKDTTPDNKEKIQKEYEERRRLKDNKKEEEERKIKAEEDEKRKKEETRQRLAARAAAFENK